MRGTVNSVDQLDRGPTGSGPTHALYIDGVRYGVFEDYGVSAGDIVDYETVQKPGTTPGRVFTNIKSVKKVEIQKPELSNGAGGYRGKSPEELAGINRAVALKAGLEWAKVMADISIRLGYVSPESQDSFQEFKTFLLRNVQMATKGFEQYLNSGDMAIEPAPKKRGPVPLEDPKQDQPFPPLDAYTDLR